MTTLGSNMFDRDSCNRTMYSGAAQSAHHSAAIMASYILQSSHDAGIAHGTHSRMPPEAQTANFSYKAAEECSSQGTCMCWEHNAPSHAVIAPPATPASALRFVSGVVQGMQIKEYMAAAMAVGNLFSLVRRQYWGL